MRMEGFCRIEQLCAYNHKTRSNHSEEIKDLKEDVRNIKSELDVMKKTFKICEFFKKKVSQFKFLCYNLFG